MKRMALAGVVGITLIGAGSLVWGMRPSQAAVSTPRSILETPDLRSVGVRRHQLEAQHQEICSRNELKRQLVLGFLAGQMEAEAMLRGIEEVNRQTPQCLEFLAIHYPGVTEREIAIWHAVGLVDGELEMARATVESRAQADSWLRDHGLIPALAW